MTGDGANRELNTSSHKANRELNTSSHKGDWVEVAGML
jgi:hypothetical protein